MNELVLTWIIVMNAIAIGSSVHQFLSWRKKFKNRKEYQYLDYLSGYKFFTKTEIMAVLLNSLAVLYGILALIYYFIL